MTGTAPAGPMTRLQVHLIDDIREGLTASGLTQAELAKRVGTHEQHLSRLLNGRQPGSIALWDALLHAVGMDA